VASATLTKVVPVFVAIMVWLIRVLIIGTFSVAGERLFSQADSPASRRTNHSVLQPTGTVTSHPRPSAATSFQSASKVARSEPAYPRPEPTYQNLSLSAKSARKAEYASTPLRS
jgi:hypothetical protein